MNYFEQIKNNKNNQFKILCLISILEIIIFLVLTILIPSDSKNAFLLGFSKSRWALIGLHFVILLIISSLYLFSEKIVSLVSNVLDHKNSQLILEMVLILLGFLIWIVLWLPIERSFLYTAFYVRVKPLLLNTLIIGFQFGLFFFIGRYSDLFKNAIRTCKNYCKRILFSIAVLAGLLVIFLLLSGIKIPVGENEFYISAGTPISSFQFILGFFIFLVFWRLESLIIQTKKQQRWISRIIFLVIWIGAIFVWVSNPLACEADRIGPFAPNYVCYPEINDAGFSVGSQYITLGEGIYNHWPYDKPFYMTFLAIGQVLFGPRIDQYLIFQIITFAFLPALLFLIGKKFSNISSGLFMALMMILIESNSITYFTEFDTVNVKLENSEHITALLLIIVFLILFAWFQKGKNPYLLFLAGGMLGAASLTRMNAFFVILAIALLLILVERKDFKQMIRRPIMLGLGFLLVFSPWLFMAKTAEGQNLYFVKIKQVIDTRYASENDEDFSKDDSQVVKENHGNESISKEGVFDNLIGIAAHITNNQILTLAKLPISYRLSSLENVSKHPIFSFNENVPIWKRQVNISYWVFILGNLFFVCMGAGFAWKRFKWAGLLPLLIQAAYHIGNGFAQTSGGRYLIPVFWVTLLYFVLGIFVLVFKLAEFVYNIELEGNLGTIDFENSKHILSEKWKNFAAVLCVIALACVVPFTELVPSQLPDEVNLSSTEQIMNILRNEGVDIEENSLLIIEGAAFHPMIYNSPNYEQSQSVFELMLLGDEHFYLVYAPDFKPENQFSDRKPCDCRRLSI